MRPIEIIVIVTAVLFVGIVFGRRLYQRRRHLPNDECAGCQKRGADLIEKYHRKYK